MPTYLKERKANPWRAQARRKGFKTEVAYFPSEDEAKEWEEARRGALRRKAKGLPSDIAELSRITIGSMIDKYLKEETAHKASAQDEAYRVEIFRNWKDIKTRPLIAFQRPDAIEFRNYLEKEYVWSGKPYMRDGRLITPKRIPKHIKPGTVKRIMATFKDMWNIAANDWKGYESLKEMDNPWNSINPKGKIRKRTRRLNDLPVRTNELERILEACKSCVGKNKLYMRLAINMAVQTGMRQQEILYLRWNDIDYDARTIDIKKSKTDYKSDVEGRVIVLPIRCQMYIAEVAALLKRHKDEIFKSNELIFPFSKPVFKHIWVRIVNRAGISSKEQDVSKGIKESQCGLEFKDLRREAGSRFDEAGLTKAEHDLMLGHESTEMRSIYIAPMLKNIKKKLDEYWINNHEYVDEVYDQGVKNKLSLQDVMLNSALKNAGVDIAAMAEYLDGQSVPGYRIENVGGMIRIVSDTGEAVQELPSNIIQLFQKKTA